MLGTTQIWVMFFIVFVDVAVTAVIFNIASRSRVRNFISQSFILQKYILNFFK